jgi:signal recognition particle receptor subunit beta
VEPSFDFKVVVAGPFASGKTTFIQAISDIPVVGTEAPTSGNEAHVKATTTVGMEYGTFTTGGEGLEASLYLYGVPGQQRFEFMWDIVAQGMDGLLVMVDATAPDTWAEAAAVARHLQAHRDPPTVVAVNRAADPAIIDEVLAAVALDGAAYVACDVRDRGSAREVLVELLLLLLDRMPEDDELDELVG